MAWACWITTARVIRSSRSSPVPSSAAALAATSASRARSARAAASLWSVRRSSRSRTPYSVAVSGSASKLISSRSSASCVAVTRPPQVVVAPARQLPDGTRRWRTPCGVTGTVCAVLRPLRTTHRLGRAATPRGAVPWCGGVAVPRCGGAAVWWCGGAAVAATGVDRVTPHRAAGWWPPRRFCISVFRLVRRGDVRKEFIPGEDLRREWPAVATFYFPGARGGLLIKGRDYSTEKSCPRRVVCPSTY